uniref:PNT domain-containing protein n=1 Tax=Parastrongyloides trichosuri TaxID=131310 RepID=A0A0N4ZB07_PARTI
MKKQSIWNENKYSCPAIASSPPTIKTSPNDLDPGSLLPSRFSIIGSHNINTDVTSSALPAKYILAAAFASNSQIANIPSGNSFNVLKSFTTATDPIGSSIQQPSSAGVNTFPLNGCQQTTNLIQHSLNNSLQVKTSAANFLANSPLFQSTQPSIDQPANNLLLPRLAGNNFTISSPGQPLSQTLIEDNITLSNTLATNSSAFSVIPSVSSNNNTNIFGNNNKYNLTSSLGVGSLSTNCSSNGLGRPQSNSISSNSDLVSAASMAAALVANKALDSSPFQNQRQSFSLDNPIQSPLNNPSLYPQLFCLQGILDGINTNILRSHMNTSQYKPIPNNTHVDLTRFRYKSPKDWTADDVLAWMIDVAKRHNIGMERFDLTQFATINGNLLLMMQEEHFIEREPTHGKLLYQELLHLISETNNNYKKVEERAVSYLVQRLKEEETHNKNKSNIVNSQQQSSSRQSLSNNFGVSRNQALAAKAIPFQTIMESSLMKNASSQNANSQINISNQIRNLGMPQQSNSSQINYSNNDASSASLLKSSPHLNSIDTTLSLNKPSSVKSSDSLFGNGSFLNAVQNQSLLSSPTPNIRTRENDNFSGIPTTTEMMDGSINNLVQKSKEFKPRKRSQHTKGNKLWEFIRDALRDPTTNPSIVKWEDSNQGVFRIIESEKLARLWGEKKNNQKMTYEKLSRAMRTYYEKQILVPVPKTGLYPKKLVYKFGPCAHGWKTDMCSGILKRNYE